MGAPIAAFLTLLLSLLLLRRLVFKPVAPGIDGALLDGSAIAALNRDRLQQLEERSRAMVLDRHLLPLPETSQQARELLIELKRLSHGSSEERSLAMRTCRAWGDRRCLPLLRRGQRDPSAPVALLASIALEVFRGEPQGGYLTAAVTADDKVSLPRNVARMR